MNGVQRGVPALKASQQNVEIDDFCWWSKQISGMVEQNQVVFVENVDHLPDEAALERVLLQEQGCVLNVLCADTDSRPG